MYWMIKNTSNGKWVYSYMYGSRKGASNYLEEVKDHNGRDTLFFTNRKDIKDYIKDNAEWFSPGRMNYAVAAFETKEVKRTPILDIIVDSKARMDKIDKENRRVRLKEKLGVAAEKLSRLDYKKYDQLKLSRYEYEVDYHTDHKRMMMRGYPRRMMGPPGYMPFGFFEDFGGPARKYKEKPSKFSLIEISPRQYLQNNNGQALKLRTELDIDKKIKTLRPERIDYYLVEFDYVETRLEPITDYYDNFKTVTVLDLVLEVEEIRKELETLK